MEDNEEKAKMIVNELDKSFSDDFKSGMKYGILITLNSEDIKKQNNNYKEEITQRPKLPFIFTILGFITLLTQLFGIFVILGFLSYLTQQHLLCIIIAIIYLILEVWKHRYFVNKGYTAKIGRYKK